MTYKKILVILPHPDDEVFPMSGTLAKMISEGSHVTYACLTLGEMGRNLGDPPFANRITLPAVRKKELETSTSIIGIQDLRLLGYHDKTIEFEPFEAIDGRLLEIVEEVKPDLVFTFYPGYGVHPDHNACGAAAIRVMASLPKEVRPVVYCSAFPTANDLGEPDVIIDIQPFLEKKLGALKAHSSQFQISEILDRYQEDEKAFVRRIGIERFWTYPFKD